MGTGGLYPPQITSSNYVQPFLQAGLQDGPPWAATADLDPALFYDRPGAARGKGHKCYNERADNYLPHNYHLQ